MPANKRMKDAIRGSIANKDAADALIALFDQFEAMQAKVKADMTKVNSLLTKLDADAVAQNIAVASSQLDEDYDDPSLQVSTDYDTVNAIDITI